MGEGMKNKVNARPITMRTRPTYQVGSRLYKTLRAAARAEAWAMIFAKYAAPLLSDVTELRGMTCECNNEEADYSCCPIHNRQYGYFSTVHKRLSAMIENAVKS